MKKSIYLIILLISLLSSSTLFSQNSLCYTYNTPPNNYEVINLTNHIINGATYYYAHKYINVIGDLTIASNASAVFYDCIFNMEPGSSLIIESSVGSQVPNFLYLNDSKIFCCNQMWQGIRLGKRSKLIMKLSVIEDARVAIGAQFGSTLSLATSRFNSNNIGIAIPYLDVGSGSVNITNIDAVEFENLRPMNESINGSTNPYCGIYLNRVTNLDLAKPLNGDRNIISNHRNGIISLNSNFNLAYWIIRNSKVLGNTLHKGYGIYCENKGNKIKIGIPTINSNLFKDNEFIDIFSNNNCNITIENNTIERDNYSTSIQTGHAPAHIEINNNTSNIEIKNNSISTLNPNTVIFFCKLYNIGSKICNINDNMLNATDNSNEIFQNYIGGIDIANSAPATSIPFKIFHNTLNWTFHSDNDYGGIGIYIQEGCYNIEVSNNTINAIHNSYSPMVVHVAEKINIFDVNTFATSPEDANCLQCSSIEFVNCLNCRICNNITSGNNQGINMRFDNLITSIGSNKFYDHQFAILYSNTSTVGQQIHTGNLFYGPFSGPPVMRCLGAYVNNEYFIDQNNYGTNLPFWPGTITPNGFVVPQSQSLKGCLPALVGPGNNDERFCTSTNFLFDSSFIQSHTNAELWSLNQDFYNLYSDGYFTNCNDSFSNFYNILYQSNLSDYANIHQKINLVNIISTELQQDKEFHQAELDQKIENLSILNQEIISDTIFDEGLEIEIIELQIIIENEYNLLNLFDSLSNLERLNKLDEIHNLIMELNPIELYEQSNKFILEINYKKLAKVPLSIAEINSLASLSDQCYIDYGKSAILAKNLIDSIPTTTFNYNDCNQNQLMNKQNNNQNYVYHENANYINIESNIARNSLIRINIYNIDGKLVFSKNQMNSESFFLDAHFLFPGTYFIQLNDLSGNNWTRKILVK